MAFKLIVLLQNRSAFPERKTNQSVGHLKSMFVHENEILCHKSKALLIQTRARSEACLRAAAGVCLFCEAVIEPEQTAHTPAVRHKPPSSEARHSSALAVITLIASHCGSRRDWHSNDNSHRNQLYL